MVREFGEYGLVKRLFRNTLKFVKDFGFGIREYPNVDLKFSLSPKNNRGDLSSNSRMSELSEGIGRLKVNNLVYQTVTDAFIGATAFVGYFFKDSISESMEIPYWTTLSWILATSVTIKGARYYRTREKISEYLDFLKDEKLENKVGENFEKVTKGFGQTYIEVNKGRLLSESIPIDPKNIGRNIASYPLEEVVDAAINGCDQKDSFTGCEDN